jgi:hypothetical protein
MVTEPIETDYLVVGTGATAMAFVDTLLSETDAHVVMVDKHHRPGGHWNDAYSFVGLHQPSAFYGVNSRELSSWTKDKTGLNEGLYELASGSEVLAHFDQVMRQRFLPSGRVQWFPMSDYSEGPGGTHHFKSLINGDNRQVIARAKLVNATHARTEVPSTHAPKYEVASGVTCIPLNRLPEVQRPHACYTVVGSGKTGMDACLWLVQNGVVPTRIRWIMPRDAWLLDRANTQPGAENFERSVSSNIGQFEAIVEATSIPDLFARLEERGLLMRIDRAVTPSVYRCAIVSQAELEQLRRIEDIVRLGHLRSVHPTQIVLEQGALPADPDTALHRLLRWRAPDAAGATGVRSRPYQFADGALVPARLQRGPDCVRRKPHQRPGREERAVHPGAQPRAPHGLAAHVGGDHCQRGALAT